MVSKHRLAVLLLAGVLTVVAALYLGGWFASLPLASRAATAPAKEPAMPRVSVSRPEEAGTPGAPTQGLPAAQKRQQFLPALPANSLPLAQQIEALVQRAQAGDTAAACRLIIGINRCDEQRRNQRYTERMIDDLQAKPQKNERALIDMAARMREQSESAGAYCSGMDAKSIPTADAILASSQERMTARQKTLLVLMRSDGSLRRLQGPVSFSESGMYMIPQFVADHSLQFLQEGFAAKDPLALEGLILLHAPASTLAPSSVALWMPNPRLFLRYSMLMHDVFGAERLGRRAYALSQQVAATIGPQEVERLRQLVAIEAAQWRDAAARRASNRSPDADDPFVDQESPCDNP